MNRLIIKMRSPFAVFLYKKLVYLLVTFIVSLTLLFVIPRLLPSSPVEMMVSRILIGGSQGSVGGGSGTSPYGTGRTAAEILRQVYIEKFGIDKPIDVQFLLFWRRIFTLDFGPSYSWYPTRVIDVIMRALPWTLILVTPIPIIGFFTGNWIGARVALEKNTTNKLAFYTSVYLSQTPYYWFALILIYFLAVQLKLFPPYGAYSEKYMTPIFSLEWILDAAHHYILPFISLVSITIGGWAIGMKVCVESQMKAAYIDYSKQLGFSSKMLRKYLIRNSILPNFTWLPIAFSNLISQTLIVEVVFGYPGIGTLMYNAAYSLDYPLLEASFLIIILVVIIGNFICDLAYGALDPTIGSRYVGEG